MPESTGDSSTSGFGANEWLVDEMFEKYQKDPNSVDKVWWDFFGKDQRQAASPSRTNGTREAADSSSSSNGTVTESTGAPKTRRSPSAGQSDDGEKPASQQKEESSSSTSSEK